MNPRQAAWLLAMAMLMLLVALAAPPAFPQDSGDGAEAEAEPADAQHQAVEQILKQQEQLLRGQRFSYDPTGRRDPFRSLYDADVDQARKRMPGIQGMYIDEIDLNGIVQDSNGGDVAYFTGSDNKGYFLRVGDHVYDGSVISIDPGRGAVTFRQQIDDPRQIKPYRDVVRTLEPVEEITND